MATAMPDLGTSTLIEEDLSTETPWVAVLYNDPVNRTSYVAHTLQEVLEIPAEEAERLMLLAHSEGKAAVKNGTFEEVDVIVKKLGAATLWASAVRG